MVRSQIANNLCFQCFHILPYINCNVRVKSRNLDQINDVGAFSLLSLWMTTTMLSTKTPKCEPQILTQLFVCNIIAIFVCTVVLFHTYLDGSTVFQRARSCWTSQNGAGQHNTGQSTHARKPWAVQWTRSWKWSKCWNPEGSRVLRRTPGCPATKCLYTPPRFYLREDTTRLFSDSRNGQRL